MFKQLLSIFFFLVVCCVSCKHNGKNDSAQAGISAKLESLNQAIQNDGKNPKLYVDRAEYYEDSSLLNNALADLNKAIELDAKYIRAYSTLSRIYLLMAQPQQSLDALNKALSIEPRNTDVMLIKAKLFLIMKDYENCAASIEQALDINPRLPDAYYLKGMALMENEKMDLAISGFQNALSIEPRHYDALMQLGYIFQSKDVNMSIDYFTTAAQVNRKSIEPLYNLGLLYQEHGQPQKSINAYESILRLDSMDKQAHYNIGYVNLVYLEKYQQAADAFTKAIRCDTTYVDAYFNRAYSFELDGKADMARKDYEAVIRLRVNDQKAIEGLNRLDKVAKKK